MSLEFGPYTSCRLSEEKAQAALRLLGKVQSSLTIQEILSKIQFENPYKKEIEKAMKIYKASYYDRWGQEKNIGFFYSEEAAEKEAADWPDSKVEEIEVQ